MDKDAFHLGVEIKNAGSEEILDVKRAV